MNIKNRTATIIAGVIVGVVAVSGTAYAIAVTTPDKPEEASTTIITTTQQAAHSEVSLSDQRDAATTSPVLSTAPLPTEKETATNITTTEASKEITFEYDAELSKQIAEMIVQKYSEMQYLPAGKLTAYPDNLIKEGKVGTANNHFIFSDRCNGDSPAQAIVDQWLRSQPDYIYQGNYSFDIEAYRFNNGYFYVEFH